MNGISRSIARGLDKDAKDKRRAPLRTYLSALNKFRSRYEKKSMVFRKSRLDAGDIWNIAENDKNRAWRIQAILAMGLIKFTHASEANTARNNAMLERFLNSKDPLEKAAAQAQEPIPKTTSTQPAQRGSHHPTT